MVNIGQLIKEELEKQGRSAGWLAKEVHCNRSTVYRALGRNRIDTAMLADISKVLHKDFFKMRILSMMPLKRHRLIWKIRSIA